MNSRKVPTKLLSLFHSMMFNSDVLTVFKEFVRLVGYQS